MHRYIVFCFWFLILQIHSVEFDTDRFVSIYNEWFKLDDQDIKHVSISNNKKMIVNEDELINKSITLLKNRSPEIEIVRVDFSYSYKNSSYNQASFCQVKIFYRPNAKIGASSTSSGGPMVTSFIINSNLEFREMSFTVKK